MWPFAARAQQSANVPRVGILSPAASEAAATLTAFREEIRNLGYIEGQTIALDFRLSKGIMDARQRVHRGGKRKAQRQPAAARRRHRGLQKAESQAGDCQARQVKPQPGFHRRADGKRCRVRCRRYAACESVDGAHLGRRRRARAPDDLGANQGGPTGRQEARKGPGQNPDIGEVAKRGRAVAKANARRFAANVRPIIEEIMRAGATSHNAIAAKLNERNVRTARGGTWTHVQVGAILRPFEASAAVA
jgi:Recombinase